MQCTDLYSKIFYRKLNTSQNILEFYNPIYIHNRRQEHGHEHSKDICKTSVANFQKLIIISETNFQNVKSLV